MATAPTGPLPWEPPYAKGAALKKAKKKKKKKKKPIIEGLKKKKFKPWNLPNAMGEAIKKKKKKKKPKKPILEGFTKTDFKFDKNVVIIKKMTF